MSFEGALLNYVFNLMHTITVACLYNDNVILNYGMAIRSIGPTKHLHMTLFTSCVFSRPEIYNSPLMKDDYRLF